MPLIVQKKCLTFARLMELSGLLDIYKSDPRIQQLVVNSHQGSRQVLRGVVGSFSAFIIAAHWFKKPGSHLIICNTKEDAAYFQNDLKNLLEKKDILFFPDSFKKPDHPEEINRSNILLRTETVTRMLNTETSGEIIVSYPQALIEKVVDTRVLSDNIIHIQKGEQLDIRFITEVLVNYGFENADFVYEPGQFSLRGGIVDIYSYGNDLPYRVELFGNEVDSIRIFDPLTQLSEKKVTSVTIVPDIQSHFKSEEKVPLFELIDAHTVIWLFDGSYVFEQAQANYEKIIASVTAYTQEYKKDETLPFGTEPETCFLDAKDLLAQVQPFAINEFSSHPYFSNAHNLLFNSSPQPPFNKNFQLLIENFKANQNNGILNFLFADNPRQINRFDQIFTDLKADVVYNPLVKSLYHGFIDNDLKIAIYTDHQIFDRYYKYQIKQSYSQNQALTIRLLRELKPGDYVTHIDHGVGVYSGLEKIEVNGKIQEAVRLVYKDHDLLYVHINSLHKISKYVGGDGTVPKVNKLGSDAWAALKRKTKNKIKDIARDLIQLYAKRKAAQGFSFASDTYLQSELEASFVYEDTPDQEKATIDVKKDMENPHPMDRLICGDVGFGKTEVAVRAAAKAVFDGKQVAILVPTTILAMQHYQTFSERLKDYPCKVDYLNRFKTAKEKKETLEKLAKGDVQIIIGTHILTGKTITFKDLGLLIVDEEQKFGVAAKERLKEMKVNVDTLTLTATPIPRTLQFSLMAARDLSIIRTPPPNRQPVTTERISFDTEKIRDAIQYEVYRGGQVFFVHNRVKDIAEVAGMIKSLCPDIDVGIAHGQMGGDELEDRMMKFVNKTYDVLVSTNIVESGLDIPNANTIIINHAQNFGLSDLHQLRGRVGRSNKKAFCYLISPPLHSLPDDSRKRLRTIEEFSELGSGFNIAMKDLDIRGAGNLLGGEQSGFIADIGFETYQKILDEAVIELKETEFKELFKEEIVKDKKYLRDVQIDTDLEMLIPDNYVNKIDERLLLYRELNEMQNEQDLMSFGDRMKDRFGPLPKQVLELFEAVRLGWAAKILGFERVIIKGHKMRCFFISNADSPFYQSTLFHNLLAIIQQKRFAAFKESGKNFMLVVEHINSIHQAQEFTSDILAKLNSSEAQ